MKTLTVKQPWASLIVEGIKDIENRTWKCPEKYIGQRVLIHASVKPVEGLPCDALNSIQYANVFSLEKLDAINGVKSAIIGSAEIVGCVTNHHSIWAEKSYECTKPGKCGLWRSNRCEVESGICINHYEFEKPVYNWILANPIKFPEPIPAKGKLGFWDFEPDQKYMECTNENPYTHISQGEREGCIQDCSNCDYYKLIYDQLS